MRHLAVSLGVVAVIVLIPVAVYLSRPDATGAELRLTVGRCTSAEHARHPAACDVIAGQPTVELVGPIDETGTPFRTTLHRADADRRVSVRLDSGRYSVRLAIGAQRSISSDVPTASVDMSTGDHDLGTVAPRAPWRS